MAKAKTEDLWGTDSGLLDNYDLTVEEAWFGQPEPGDDGKQDDRIFLFLSGDAEDEEGEIHEDHIDRYSVGKGWEVVEEGAEVEHGSRRKFNTNTGAGRLVNTLMEVADLDELRKKGNPIEASTFVGLVLSQKRRVVSTFESDDGETIKWELPLPIEVAFGKKKAAGKGKGKPAAKTSKKADEKALTKKVQALANKMAGKGEDHDDFLDAALDKFPEIEDFDELHADVLDEDGDIWTAATE